MRTSSHAPSHGTREVLIIYGALLSSDPGDIHDTIAALVADRIRVSVVGLSAQVAICAELCARTNSGQALAAGPGVPSWSSSSGTDAYTVALHEAHFRDLVLAATTPPVTHQTQRAAADGNDASAAVELSEAASLLMMGFPSRTVAETAAVAPAPKPANANNANAKGGGGASTASTKPLAALSLCACHNAPIREGYGCTRCGTRVCRLPIECPACGLTLVLSTHLARSYHHLFPLRNWVEVSWSEAADAVAGRQTVADPLTGERRRLPRQTACFACQVPFNKIPKDREWEVGGAGPGKERDKGKGKEKDGKAKAGGGKPSEPQQPPLAKGLSESGRYACPVCGSHFCIDCDVYAHEVIHNCPGCQGDTRAHARAAAALLAQVAAVEEGAGAMELDSQPPAGRDPNGTSAGVANGRHGSRMDLD